MYTTEYMEYIKDITKNINVSMLIIAVAIVGAVIAAMIFFAVKPIEKFTAVTYEHHEEESGVLPLNEEKEQDVSVEVASFDKSCELNYSKV